LFTALVALVDARAMLGAFQPGHIL
jgi:hypothetical protein